MKTPGDKDIPSSSEIEKKISTTQTGELNPNLLQIFNQSSSQGKNVAKTASAKSEEQELPPPSSPEMLEKWAQSQKPIPGFGRPKPNLSASLKPDVLGGAVNQNPSIDPPIAPKQNVAGKSAEEIQSDEEIVALVKELFKERADAPSIQEEQAPPTPPTQWQLHRIAQEQEMAGNILTPDAMHRSVLNPTPLISSLDLPNVVQERDKSSLKRSQSLGDLQLKFKEQAAQGAPQPSTSIEGDIPQRVRGKSADEIVEAFKSKVEAHKAAIQQSGQSVPQPPKQNVIGKSVEDIAIGSPGGVRNIGGAFMEQQKEKAAQVLSQVSSGNIPLSASLTPEQAETLGKRDEEIRNLQLANQGTNVAGAKISSSVASSGYDAVFTEKSASITPAVKPAGIPASRRSSTTSSSSSSSSEASWIPPQYAPSTKQTGTTTAPTLEVPSYGSKEEWENREPNTSNAQKTASWVNSGGSISSAKDDRTFDFEELSDQEMELNMKIDIAKIDKQMELLHKGVAKLPGGILGKIQRFFDKKYYRDTKAATVTGCENAYVIVRGICEEVINKQYSLDKDATLAEDLQERNEELKKRLEQYKNLSRSEIKHLSRDIIKHLQEARLVLEGYLKEIGVSQEVESNVEAASPSRQTSISSAGAKNWADASKRKESFVESIPPQSSKKATLKRSESFSEGVASNKSDQSKGHSR